MNYTDIKDQVVRVDKTLELMPAELLEQMKGLPSIGDLWALNLHWTELQHIETVVHALMEIDSRRYYTVATVLMDDVPAFYYMAGGREGSDFCDYHVLNVAHYKAFATYLHQLSLETMELKEVDVSEDVPHLTEFYGQEIRYGDHWCCDNPDDMWVVLR